MMNIKNSARSKRVPTIKTSILILLMVAIVNSATTPLAFGDSKIEKNGFDLTDSLIPIGQILSGGPPKDGIPTINSPKFLDASNATFLTDQSRILGLSLNGSAKAYPIAILNWHEVVNDYFDKQKVAITYCPLCGTGVAFDTGTQKKGRSFGVSGLLYNSDVLLYDRETNSLWSQIMRKAVTGTLKGEKLTLLPLTHTTWADWKKQYPQTKVLSTETGYNRNYSRDPYSRYENSEKIWFPVSTKDTRFTSKEFVLGVELAGKYKAYPFSELQKTTGKIQETFQGQMLTITFNKNNRTASVIRADGKILPTIQAYWFAWFAFHPKTKVFKFTGSQ